MDEKNISQQELESCFKVLNTLKTDPEAIPSHQVEKLKTLITKVYKQARKGRRKESIEELRAQDADVLQNTTIVQQANDNTSSYAAESVLEKGSAVLNKPQTCYRCHQSYREMHFFYHRLCPECAELNYRKRFERGNLKNRVAVITGGRVKVGYATALKLLRDGAKVIVTTRFPHNAYSSFAKEDDFESWKDSLVVYCLDLRYFDQINGFVQYLFETEACLDILINNAAQTIKYPEEYYQPLVQKELIDGQSGRVFKNLISSSGLFLEEHKQDIGQGLLQNVPLNRFSQPVDERSKNSWISLLDEINTEELVEVNLINNIAPFILNSQLKPLFKKSSFRDKYIINVTSSEGQFSYPNKKTHHPHTNMTKAALNMMTRTSAEDYAEDGIYMSSVDVGWVSTGIPEEKRKKIFDQGGVPPLDPVDSAARIYHPILSGIDGKPMCGKLIKDYLECEW